MPLPAALARISSAAAAILRIDGGHLAPGAPADLCLFDPNEHWLVEAASLRSQGRHSPYLGRELAGRSRITLVGGRIVYSRPA